MSEVTAKKDHRRPKSENEIDRKKRLERVVEKAKPDIAFWLESKNVETGKKFINPQQPGAKRTSTRIPKIAWPPVDANTKARGRYQPLVLRGKFIVDCSPYFKDEKEILEHEQKLTLDILHEIRGNSTFQGLLRYDAQEIVNTGKLPYSVIAKLMQEFYPQAPEADGETMVRYPCWRDNPNHEEKDTVLFFRELRNTQEDEVSVFEERQLLNIANLERFAEKQLLLLANCLGKNDLNPREDKRIWVQRLYMHIQGMSKQAYDSGVDMYLQKEEGK